MGRRDLPGEYTLLCERCGYDIESLPKDAACPECGKPIGESLPEARQGTPWQRRRSGVSLVVTWFSILQRASQAFAVASVGVAPTTLLTLSLGAASLAIGGLAGLAFDQVGDVSVVRAGGGSISFTTSGPVAIMLAVGVALAAWPVLVLLTWIEERGIRFWGPRRGWRITPAIAKVICAHASVGWLLGSVLAVPAHLLGLAMLEWTNHNNAGAFRGPMQLAPITLPALCLIGGMLTFEVLVYTGMNRMRFANRARPTPDAAPLDSLMPSASLPSPSITPAEPSLNPPRPGQRS